MSRTPAEWDESAAAYDKFENRWHYYARVAQGLIRRLRLGRTSNVLELASGTGASTAALVSKCRSGSVTCVERSSGMMALAQRNLEKAGLHATILQGDVSKLAEVVEGLPPFDFAFCNSAFWHFPEPLQVMKAVKGTLKSGGWFGFNIPTFMVRGVRSDEYRRIAAEVLARHGMEPRGVGPRVGSDYAELLRTAGYKTVKEGKYSLMMEAAERAEWRAIPVFSKSWAWNRDLTPQVVAEIRKETRRAGLPSRPSVTGGRNVWNYYLAKR